MEEEELDKVIDKLKAHGFEVNLVEKDEIPDFTAGDILEVPLPTPENVMITIIYVPTGKKIAEFRWLGGF